MTVPFLQQWILYDPTHLLEKLMGRNDFANFDLVNNYLPNKQWLIQKITNNQTNEISYQYIESAVRKGSTNMYRFGTLTQNDYTTFINGASFQSFIKRYEISNTDNDVFFVDFFKKDEFLSTYFATMEITSEKDFSRLDVPELISPFITYRVTPGDNRFNKRFLADITNALSLINDIIFWTRN